MLAENSNYYLKNETKYQERDPEELSETQTGLSTIQSASSIQKSVQKTRESPKQPQRASWRTEIFPKNNL